MADKKKHGKKGKKDKDHSVTDTLGANVDHVGDTIASSVTKAIGTVEDVSGDTKQIAGDAVRDAASTVKDIGGETQQVMTGAAKDVSGTALAVLDKVKPDHKSGKKSKKKDKKSKKNSKK